MRVFARDHAEHTERGGHGITATFDRELHNVLGIEVDRVGSKAGARRMLDALVHRQYGEVTRAAEATGVKHLLQTAQHLWITISRREDAIHEIRPGQMQLFLGDGFALVFEEGLGGIAEEFGDFSAHGSISISVGGWQSDELTAHSMLKQ